MSVISRVKGVFGRLRRGWGLARDSASVLFAHPKLLVFPAISSVTALLYGALIFAAPTIVKVAPIDSFGVGLLAVLYAVLVFITTFFQGALVYNARESFTNGTVSLRDGIRAAWARKGHLLMWAVVSATIGLVLRALEKRGNKSATGRVAKTLFATGWSILTFFIIPVAMFDDDVGLWEMFNESGRIFKDEWGETAGASAGASVITLVLGAAALVVVGVLFAYTNTDIWTIASVGVILFVLVYVFASGLSLVTRTGLYLETTTDTTTTFDPGSPDVSAGGDLNAESDGQTDTHGW